MRHSIISSLSIYNGGIVEDESVPCVGLTEFPRERSTPYHYHNSNICFVLGKHRAC